MSLHMPSQSFLRARHHRTRLLYILGRHVQQRVIIDTTRALRRYNTIVHRVIVFEVRGLSFREGVGSKGI